MSIHIFQFRNFLSFAEKRPPPEKLHKGFFGQNDEGRDTVKKRLMLWGYLLVLGWLLLFGRRPGAPGQGSFVPFLGVWRVYLCWRNVGFRLAIIPLRELVGNVLLFLPLGILLGREKFWQGRPFRMLLTGALLSTFLESCNGPPALAWRMWTTCFAIPLGRFLVGCRGRKNPGPENRSGKFYASG